MRGRDERDDSQRRLGADDAARQPVLDPRQRGTIRGSVRKGSDFVELERDGAFTRYPLVGQWMPDGFAGTMGELQSAIADDREPFNSARHNLLSLQLTLAACRSAERDGRPVSPDEVAS